MENICFFANNLFFLLFFPIFVIAKNFIYSIRKMMDKNHSIIISIITICYNEVSTIEKTLTSVISQTYTNKEYIVIDGNSTDGTKEIIEKFANSITYWQSKPDNGIYNAMNIGVQHATGDYVIFINGGDSFYDTTTLEKMAINLGDIDIIEGRVVSDNQEEWSIRPHFKNLFKQLICESLDHQGTFIRRKLLVDNPYDEKYKIASDYKFTIEELLLKERSYRFVDTLVAKVNVSGISQLNPTLSLMERRQIYEELFPSPITEGFIEYRNTYKRHDNALVKYAVYLKENNNFAYCIVRKIAKRLVKLTKILNRAKRH